jgi:hypothetical protein
MNGELRDCERVMRTLEKSDTPILTGMRIYHNYIRPHMALDGKTRADLAGIQIEGENRWFTIIQNASQSAKTLEGLNINTLSDLFHYIDRTDYESLTRLPYHF